MLPSCEKTWRNIKCILLSKRSQSEKATILKLPHCRKGKTIESKDQWLPRLQRRKGGKEGMRNRRNTGFLGQ